MNDMKKRTRILFCFIYFILKYKKQFQRTSQWNTVSFGLQSIVFLIENHNFLKNQIIFLINPRDYDLLERKVEKII